MPACSACSRYSINHREVCMPTSVTLPSCVVNSPQTTLMPCRRSSFSSSRISRTMIHLHHGITTIHITQTVVAPGIGHR